MLIVLKQYVRVLLSYDCFMQSEPGPYGLGRVYIWRRASPLYRDPASQLNSLSTFVFVYMSGGPALLGEISLLTTEISPRRARNFPYKRKSKLRTHDKGCLDQHFLDNFLFPTSSVCLCVGYKMKTCTQISDSGFRQKINV